MSRHASARIAFAQGMLCQQLYAQPTAVTNTTSCTGVHNPMRRTTLRLLNGDVLQQQVEWLPDHLTNNNQESSSHSACLGMRATH